MKISREDLVESLNAIRESAGDEAYYEARRSLALMLIGTEEGKKFLNETFPDLDLDDLAQEAEQKKVLTDNDLFNLIKLQVPNLKTQAQFDAYRIAFESLSYMANAYYGGQEETALRAYDALEDAIKAIREAAVLAQRVDAIPVEERSQRMNDLTGPPREFQEVEEQRRLLDELEALTTSQELTQWYSDSRKRMDIVVSQPYRNQLFDAIRAKQQALSN